METNSRSRSGFLDDWSELEIHVSKYLTGRHGVRQDTDH